LQRFDQLTRTDLVPISGFDTVDQHMQWHNTNAVSFRDTVRQVGCGVRDDHNTHTYYRTRLRCGFSISTILRYPRCTRAAATCRPYVSTVPSDSCRYRPVLPTSPTRNPPAGPSMP